MFVKRRAEAFRHWWRAPITTKDRASGAFVGAVGGFWVGILARIVLGSSPVSISELGIWALGAAACGVVLGAVFPKAVTCVLFPFAISGISSS